MFGVLLESRAVRARRPGGVLLSLLVHAAAVGTAIVLTVRESPAKVKCAVSPCGDLIPIVERFDWPERRTVMGAGHGPAAPESKIRTPRPIAIVFGSAATETPLFGLANPATSAATGRDFCEKASDCAVGRASASGDDGWYEEIRRGPDLVARIIGSSPRPRYPEALRAAGLVLSASVEAEIAGLAPDEQAAFLEDLGLRDSALARFIRAAYGLLDLISFFTVGEDEVRAWPIHRGTRAREAAGRIHSDLERGFIRAEVIPYAVFLEHGSEHAVKVAGRLQIEGKDYVVSDGDIMHVRFNV